MHIAKISILAQEKYINRFISIMKCDNDALENCSKTTRHKVKHWRLFSRNRWNLTLQLSLFFPGNSLSKYSFSFTNKLLSGAGLVCSSSLDRKSSRPRQTSPSNFVLLWVFQLSLIRPCRELKYQEYLRLPQSYKGSFHLCKRKVFRLYFGPLVKP